MTNLARHNSDWDLWPLSELLPAQTWHPTPTQAGVEFLDKYPACKRLLLRPTDNTIRLERIHSLGESHGPRYLARYHGAVPSLRAPAKLPLGSLEVRLCIDSSDTDGHLTVHGDSNFYAFETRLVLALELLHGRKLRPVFRRDDDTFTFYRSCDEQRLSYMPMVTERADNRANLQAMLDGLLAMDESTFDFLRTACQFVLHGKQMGAPLEVSYLMLMVFVEALDGKRSTNAESTAQMLGVSAHEATVFNGMRHQLMHGKGGFPSAYLALIQEQFEGKAPSLSPEFAVFADESTCDFGNLWLRLCERVDAYLWRSLLGSLG